MSDEALQKQIRDLVDFYEPQNGWSLDELAADLWGSWRNAVHGHRPFRLKGQQSDVQLLPNLELVENENGYFGIEHTLLVAVEGVKWRLPPISSVRV